MKKQQILYTFIAFGLTISLAANLAHGAIWYVDSSVAVSGTGTSWASPVKTVQEAITKASNLWFQCQAPFDQIWVKEGVYPLSSEITVNKVVAIFGGFDGTETTLSQRDIEANPTIIDGQLHTRCMKITSLCEIDGFTFRFGRRSTTAGTGTGAGIYLDEVPTYECFSGTLSVMIRNCTFYYNSAGTSVPGGAIYDLRSSPKISDCIFQSNTAERGGAIFTWQSSPIIERCVFQNNQSTSSGSWGGGAICGDYLVYGSITNCLFDNNSSNSWGGALAYHMGYPDVTNCTFVNNSAALGGDAVHTNTCDPDFKNCIFWDDSTNEFYHSAGVNTPYVSYSNIKGGYSGPGNISVDPKFVAWNDFQLDHNSPCIDKGTNSGAPSTDLLGVARPQDGDDNGTATADMGAYEYTFVDLMIWGWATIPTSPAVGEPFDIKITIYNAGTYPVEKYFWVDWYANQPTPPTINDYGQQYATVPSIGAKSYYYITLHASYAAAGNYQMYVQADTTNRINEKQEGNNLSGPRTINVLPKYDVNVLVRPQGSCREPAGFVFPLNVKFFNPGADIFSATPIYEFNKNTTISGSLAYIKATNIKQGTYDITAVGEHSLTSVKTNALVDQNTFFFLGDLYEGDIIKNHMIDLADAAAMAQAWATSTGQPDFNPQADLDLNGQINLCDFALIANNWYFNAPVFAP